MNSNATFSKTSFSATAPSFVPMGSLNSSKIQTQPILSSTLYDKPQKETMHSIDQQAQKIFRQPMPLFIPVYEPEELQSLYGLIEYKSQEQSSTSTSSDQTSIAPNSKPIEDQYPKLQSIHLINPQKIEDIEQRTQQIFKQVSNVTQHMILEEVKQLKKQNLEAQVVKHRIEEEPKNVVTAKEENHSIPETKKNEIESLNAKIEEVKVEEESGIVDDNLTFTKLAERPITDRHIIPFEKHRIPYGKDFSPEFKKGELASIGAQHAKMRMELFFKLCKFVEKNRRLFSHLNMNPRFSPKNQFKAQANFVPKLSNSTKEDFKSAHISIFPNLVYLDEEEKGVHVKGGKIPLSGKIIRIEEMLNLTNKAPTILNNIDAISEVYLRFIATRYLKDVSDGACTAETAVKRLIKDYDDCLEVLEFKAKKGLMSTIPVKQAQKIKEIQGSIEKQEFFAYQGHFSFYKDLGPDYTPYITGMRRGIKNLA